MPRPKDYHVKVDRRDSTTFVIAFEGEKTELIYFRSLTVGRRRVNLVPLPTEPDGKSAPKHLLFRLDEWLVRNAVREADRMALWLVMDVDHHFRGNHVRDTHGTLDEARRRNVQVAVSAPCFELWLLLHLEEVDQVCTCDAVEQRLKFLMQGYNHNRYDPTGLLPGVAEAVRRAEALDATPDQREPSNPGTQVYRLVRALDRAGARITMS